VADIIEYRLNTEQIINRVEDVSMPTDYGDFQLIAFRSMDNPEPHLALCKGGIGEVDSFGKVAAQTDPVLVRVQPECLLGGAFKFGACRCGQAIDAAIRQIEKEGKGAFVLLRRFQGPRIEDAVNPCVRAAAAKDRLAPKPIGPNSERRDFGLGSQILQALGLRKLRVMTNSNLKIYGLEGFGLSLVERVPLEIEERVT
ncbi:MAG: bifunctional 3,4-dihydroxy-2-butanone-4-phosphate synthase/GTP cyclohydrolase II, partial [Planctomycetota bacterium]|nr:bifunctional 3,4-dihydroxy-2-butanone-4-phosphate synthase/GTP cyclohydrolase II [Planctomycetota bacterium]